MKKMIYLLGLGLLFTTGCAHHRDVRPGVDGMHSVVVLSEGGEEGTRNAISQANHYCGQLGKHAAFVEEDQKYTGKVDEETYNTGKTIGKVLTTVGGAGYVFGGSNEKNAGGVGVLAGQAANVALGKGYTVKMKFKCQ